MAGVAAAVATQVTQVCIAPRNAAAQAVVGKTTGREAWNGAQIAVQLAPMLIESAVTAAPPSAADCAEYRANTKKHQQNARTTLRSGHTHPVRALRTAGPITTTRASFKRDSKSDRRKGISQFLTRTARSGVYDIGEAQSVVFSLST